MVAIWERLLRCNFRNGRMLCSRALDLAGRVAAPIEPAE